MRVRNLKLCNICYPFLVWFFRIKIPLQQIWRDFSHFSLIRTVFFDSDTTNQTQQLHQPLNRLMIEIKPTIAQFCRDTTIAISTFVFVVDSNNLCFYVCIFICLVHLLCMIVKGCTRQLSD